MKSYKYCLKFLKDDLFEGLYNNLRQYVILQSFRMKCKI